MNVAITALQKQLKEQNVDALFITTPANRFYVSKFESSAGCAFITQTKAYFIVDFRYIEAAKSNVQQMEVVMLSKAPYGYILEMIEKFGIKTIGFEENSIGYQQFKTIEQAWKNCTFVGFEKNITALRQVKTADEIFKITHGQEINEKAFEHILNYIKVGRTERDIQIELEYYLQKEGGNGLAFDSIVVSGQNTSKPHGVPTDKKIESGDFITMDFGCKYMGYCSDMTRTVGVSYVTDEMHGIYETVLQAQTTALAGIKAGMSGTDIDALARSIIEEKGFGTYFGHSLGHSVGIEVHEKPSFAIGYEEKIEKDTIMSVEPGIYINGKFGVRIEDLVLITPNGVKNLNKSRKDLIIL